MSRILYFHIGIARVVFKTRWGYVKITVCRVGAGGAMDTGNIAILGNACCQLGFYLFSNTAVHFEDDFDTFNHVFHNGFTMDPRAWAAEKDVRGVVIGGSLKSPLNDDPWIREEEVFVRGLVEMGMPILGICFGHELLASALGGQIEKQRRMRLKLDTIRIVREDPLFAGYQGEFLCPVSHSVNVTAMPPDFVLLARSEECEIMVMKHMGLPVYGIQFHPEMTPDIKHHDPTWNPMPDEDIARNQGAQVIRNFSAIVAAHYEKRIGV
jgi:GMP synthase-like glutamine amidotransferase